MHNSAYIRRPTCILPPQKADPHLKAVGGWQQTSRGMPAEAMPPVVKVLAEVPPWALREVDRLSRNPEKLANVGGTAASESTSGGHQSQSQAWRKCKG